MTDLAEIAAVRAFNRFHTRHVGALDARILDGDLSLTETRLLYELVARGPTVAVDLQRDLGLDAGYLSRMLRRFEVEGWIERTQGKGGDGRRRPIALTEAGRQRFQASDALTRAEVGAQLASLSKTERAELVEALATAQRLLARDPKRGVTYRTFRTGDMGYVTARQAIFYEEQFGWGPGYEALVGEITARFLREFKPGREQAWIAECNGVMAGSIFLVDAGDNIGQLRLLYVEPTARGRGIGSELVARCIAFAREAGYERMRLWTNDVLVSARKIYEAAGFRLIAEEPHDHFGKGLIGQTWELAF